MAENAPIPPGSAASPTAAPVTTVSAAAGPAEKTGPAAAIPVATISVATSQGTAVPVATVLVATVPPAAKPPAGAPAATAHPESAPRETDAPKTAPQKHSGANHAYWIVPVLAILVGGVIGYVIYKNQKKPPVKAPPPVTISTTNAVKGNFDEFVPVIGTVTPVYTAMISPRVDGQLIKVNYTEGQMVTTNDLLAEIDPGPYQASLTQAEGQLARDKALLEGANIDLTRYEQAYNTPYGTNESKGTNVLHAIGKQQVDDQRALVHQDEGTVKFDEGQVASAKVQLAYCFIHAPIAGRTGLRLVDPGNVVHAANTNAIVVVAQLQPITVVFNVDQKQLPAMQRQMQIGHKMTVEALNSDKSQKLATGAFQTLDNLIDMATGTIKIKATFENQDLMLFPNQFVNVKLIVDTLSNVTLIPTVAIQRNPQGTFVYVVTNKEVTLTNQSGTVRTNQTVVAMRTITVGVNEAGVDDAGVIPVEGLEPGEVIATDNYNKLGDGMQVSLRRTGGPGQRGGPPGGKKKGGKKDQAQDDAP
jgi:membrane fusion protein, multidrug efflux system